MMENQVTSAAGANQRRKRVGRGEASGHGKTCCRGNKGMQSRAGGGTRLLHEGGQMPIFRRLPKRGFNNFHFRVAYQAINLCELEQAFEAGERVSPEVLRERGLLGTGDRPVKILGQGPLTRKLTVEAHAFSRSARAAIEQAGGTVSVRERKDPAMLAKAKRNTKRRERSAKRAGPAPEAS
jgi:large subunit ribosomal protein L15